MIENNCQCSDQSTAAEQVNPNLIINILRILAVLEKALDRVGRLYFHDRNQYPLIMLEIEGTIIGLRVWIDQYKCYCGVSKFHEIIGLCILEIQGQIGKLMLECEPVKGKKGVGFPRKLKQYKKIMGTISDMLIHLLDQVKKFEAVKTDMGFAIGKFLVKAFEDHCTKSHEIEVKRGVSKRGKQTCVFPWSDKKGYHPLISDTKRFRKVVISRLDEYCHATGHKPTCKRSGRYKLIGFRSNPRKTIMEGGKQEVYPIRMAECTECGAKFSILPSFLPREKNFGIDIIGNALRGLLLFAQSYQAGMENIKMSGGQVKSKQTILNWIRWMGTHHPAVILTMCGVTGSGYLQEDEGFEKEAWLRTYTVVMVDPINQLVWHLDYVDHVDEETLYDSFEKFVERIDFKILGVTKDKWKPSTNALKKVIKNLWIGFCHRHCLKKFLNNLLKYQKETGCSDQERKKIYQEFKKVLESASSKNSLNVKINLLKHEAFNHPLLSSVLDELKKNAVHYTAHKIRSGIKKTTSLVDNFLKIVKRKLRQVESFRDKECTCLMFRAMANVRNFVPFLPGAKNAHKSPFILAGGEDYDLPWIQTMNVHNAFLFVENTE